MSNHIWPHLHSSLVDTETNDGHSEQPWQVTCFREKLMTFKELPNVFGNADNILVVGYDDEGMNYDNMQR